jgi:hypothetical protein
MLQRASTDFGVLIPYIDVQTTQTPTSGTSFSFTTQINASRLQSVLMGLRPATAEYSNGRVDQSSCFRGFGNELGLRVLLSGIHYLPSAEFVNDVGEKILHLKRALAPWGDMTSIRPEWYDQRNLDGTSVVIGDANIAGCSKHILGVDCRADNSRQLSFQGINTNVNSQLNIDLIISSGAKNLNDHILHVWMISERLCEIQGGRLIIMR